MENEEYELETAPVTVGDMDSEVNEAPLSPEEEANREENAVMKEREELMLLFENVKGMKALLDDHTVQNAMFRVIDGNIDHLRDQLETEEKSREVVLAQGKLMAYKQMRDFPSSSVELFNNKLFAIRNNLGLFLDDSFIQEVQISYNQETNRIHIMQPGPVERPASEEDLDYEESEAAVDDVPF